MKTRIGLVVTVIASLGLGVSACGSGAAPTGQITGAIVQVGGALKASSEPLNATALVYRQVTTDDRVTGPVVAHAKSSRSDGGKVTISVPPGTYYVVVEDGTGQVTGAQKVTVVAGKASRVNLDVAVP